MCGTGKDLPLVFYLVRLDAADRQSVEHGSFTTTAVAQFACSTRPEADEGMADSGWSRRRGLWIMLTKPQTAPTDEHL